MVGNLKAYFGDSAETSGQSAVWQSRGASTPRGKWQYRGRITTISLVGRVGEASWSPVMCYLFYCIIRSKFMWNIWKFSLLLHEAKKNQPIHWVHACPAGNPGLGKGCKECTPGLTHAHKHTHTYTQWVHSIAGHNRNPAPGLYPKTDPSLKSQGRKTLCRVALSACDHASPLLLGYTPSMPPLPPPIAPCAHFEIH